MAEARHLSLSADELRSRLDYDPATGRFTWRHSPDMPERWNTRWAGKPAGQRNVDGRGSIRINYTRYLSARLAWLYVSGEWPAHEIDHIDCDPGNDRFSNLRPATRSENMSNTRLRVTNAAGAKGVCFDRSRGKWLAHISTGGRFKYLGRFETKEAAATAYATAAMLYFGPFARVA